MGGSSEQQMPQMDSGIQSSSPESIPQQIGQYEAEMYNSQPTEADLTQSAHDAAGTETTNPDDPRSEEYKRRKKLADANAIQAYFSRMPSMTMQRPQPQSGSAMNRPLDVNSGAPSKGLVFNSGRPWNIQSSHPEYITDGITSAISSMAGAYASSGSGAGKSSAGKVGGGGKYS